MKMSKAYHRKVLRDVGTVETPSEPPSPAAIIARDKAVAAAAQNPLAYALGEPLPGRSALDKLRARQAAGAVDDEVDDRTRGPRGMPKSLTISPGRFINNGSRHNTHRD